MDVRMLSKSPRKIDLVSMTDGNVYTFEDDGGSVVDGALLPNGKRQNLMRQLKKELPDGSPLYMARSPVSAVFTGDPIARVPVMTRADEKKLAENKAARDDTARIASERGKREAAAFLRAAARMAESGADVEAAVASLGKPRVAVGDGPPAAQKTGGDDGQP